METKWRVTTYTTRGTKQPFPEREYDTACGAALFIGLAHTMFDDVRFNIEQRDGDSWRVVGTLELIDAADREAAASPPAGEGGRG